MPGLGEVRVFLPEEPKYPPGGYQQAADAACLLLKKLGAERMEDVQSPDLFRQYYVLLYELARIAEVSDEIRAALEARSFEEVTRCYHLIDQDAISVLVPYDLEAYEDLKAELRDAPLNAGWIRRARPHAVSLYRPKTTDPLWRYLDPAPLGRRRGQGRGEKDPQTQEWFVYLDEDGYDRELLGLVGPADELWIA
jgi:hypothetical protein